MQGWCCSCRGLLAKRESACVSCVALSREFIGFRGSATPNKFEHALPHAPGRTPRILTWPSMEMDIRTELSLELTRIIECPYPASLSVSICLQLWKMTRCICAQCAVANTQTQKLEDLLARADEVTIRSCIHDRPSCAVTRLATLVCDALPLWAYTSHVLQLLCTHENITCPSVSS